VGLALVCLVPRSSSWRHSLLALSSSPGDGSNPGLTWFLLYMEENPKISTEPHSVVESIDFVLAATSTKDMVNHPED